MKFPRYPSYKPSDAEWLGEIPKHWEVRKITHGFGRIGSGTTPKSDSVEYYDGEIPWVTTSELRETVICETKQAVTSAAVEDYPSLRVYPQGTVLFAMYGATIGRLGILGIPAAVNQACCAFAWPTFFEQRFVFYWLWMRRPILVSLSSGGGQPNLSQDDLCKIRIAVPSPLEQKAIADFLDRETAKVDTLVRKKRELIEKLKEKRAALISRTVTRGLPPDAARAAGLNPHPKLKSSGIDWLGDVPKHWEVKAISRLASAIQTGPFGSQLHESDYVDGGIPLINPAHIVGGQLVPDDHSAVDERTAWRLSRHRLRAGDIIMGRRGEIGRCAVVTSKEDGWLCGTGAVVIFLAASEPRYFGKVFSSGGFSNLLELNAVGTTMPNLNPVIIGRMLVPEPPFAEQRAIADYLDRETNKIDRIVAKIEAAIEKLQEYRTALITAAVTGKIDVRGLGPAAAQVPRVATEADGQVIPYTV